MGLEEYVQVGPGDLDRFDTKRFHDTGCRFPDLRETADAFTIVGLYAPRELPGMDYQLKQPAVQGVLTDRISSGTLEITLTKDPSWLKEQLAGAPFWDRLHAARRLAPLIGNEAVLAELK